MRRKTRYTSEKQIVTAIDKTISDGQALLVGADTLEHEGKRLLREPKTIEDGRHAIAKAKKMREQATRKLEKRAPLLGQKLSEFRTMLLPNTGVTDPSVVL